jgi:hypothetical protein
MHKNSPLLKVWEGGITQKNLHWIQLVLNPRHSACEASILSLDHPVLFGVMQLSDEAKMHKLFLKLFDSEWLQAYKQ